jgi:GalNAc-alpha-(1->4)-GalNAc-alpha-(1->3)-diNAcBac-PP-undecaprenol alpha-1,4-N-acetyl-D-galactosaminyltransferase
MVNPQLTSADPPSILLITGRLDCGGAQRVLADIANYWAQRGWQITLATWSRPQEQDFYPLAPNITRMWFDAESRGRAPFAVIAASVARIFKLRRWLQTSRVDAALSFIDVSNVHLLLAAAGLGVRTVVCERTHPGINRTVALPWRVLRWICYRWADRVVAQTQDAAHWLEQHCGVPALVIPNPVRALPRIVCEREPLIIGVGRLSPEKGFDLLLKAFAALAPAFPEWRLAIVGDGPQRTALAELRAQLRLAERVELVGQTRDVETWMARAGLLVHPSRREGFPNAVMEAMAMGVPVICADCQAGPSELIQDGINGRLVSVGDVAELERAMALLMRSPELRERLGQEAAKIARRYEPGVIMDKWAACLLGAGRR